MKKQKNQIYTRRKRGAPVTLEWLLSNTTADEKGCMNWTGAITGDGYGLAKAFGKYMTTHRISYILANGEIPDGLCVMHSCDNHQCINPDHLSVGTVRDNIRDCIAKGRVNRPKTNVVLPDSDVIDIFHSSDSLRVLAKRYGVGATTICDIKNKKTRIKLLENL